SRVDRQVQDHLLELARVGLDVSQLRVEYDLELDVLSDQAVEQQPDVADDVIQVEDLRRQQLTAAEGEQLLCQRSGALTRARDVLRPLPLRAVHRELPEQELREADDRCEHVVEVVGYPACEAADRLESLRLPSL